MTIAALTLTDLETRITFERDLAKNRAIDALARYKFERFGYWASTWVTLNSIAFNHQANPFVTLVKLARSLKLRLPSERGAK